MAAFCPQARKYLDFLAAHPGMTRAEIEKEIGSGQHSVERWVRMYGQDFRGEELAIRSRWKVVEAKRKQVAATLKAGRPAPTGQPVPESEEQDPRLAIFLEHYAALLNRTKALQRCREEGVSLQLEDAQAAINGDTDFRRRFLAIFERAITEIEDGQMDNARKGKTQSALAVLRAHRPQQYGNRMRITVDGGLQLSLADRNAVEDAKVGAVRKFRQRAAKSAAMLPGGTPPEDVVDGVVIAPHQQARATLERSIGSDAVSATEGAISHVLDEVMSLMPAAFDKGGGVN